MIFDMTKRKSGGGSQTVSFIDWQNKAVTSSTGQIVGDNSRIMLPHRFYKFSSLFVPSAYDYALWACKIPLTGGVAPSTTYIGGWTGTAWSKTLTWLSGGTTLDLTTLTGWDEYYMAIVVRNHGENTSINPSAGNSIEFVYDPSVGLYLS